MSAPTHLPPTAANLNDLQQRLIGLLDELRTIQPRSRDTHAPLGDALLGLYRVVESLGQARACEQREELGEPCEGRR